MKSIKEEKIKDILKKWDTENWKEESSGKCSLHIYKEHKLDIREESCYSNHPSSSIFFRCRANIIPLEDKNNFKTNGDVTCKECGAEREDLELFLLHCPLSQDLRNNSRLFDQPYSENCVGHILFENIENREEIKNIIQQFWQKREKSRKERAQP